MRIQEVTVELSYGELANDPLGRAALAVLEAVAAAQIRRRFGAAATAEVVGMGKVTCQVNLNNMEEQDE
jgi:hypothetical protein